jgi:hypothetical protein
VKKLLLAIAMLAMMLASTATAVAQTESANSIQGYITSISGSVVLVEENPADESGSAKGVFTVTGDTEILKQQGGEQVSGTLDDLQVGQTVLATYAGPVGESYPTQGEAGSIVILEGSSGDDDRCLLPEGCDTGGDVVATAVIEKAGATYYQYGTHTLVDGGTGELIYALTSQSVDLDAYEGELATIYGTYVPGYEEGVDGGPPLVDVDRVETAPDGGSGDGSDTGGSDKGGSNSGSSNSGGSNNGGTKAGKLPETGGAAPIALGAGALLLSAASCFAGSVGRGGRRRACESASASPAS